VEPAVPGPVQRERRPHAIDNGLRITTGPGGADETARAQAFGKFMQGITLGYLSLYYDKAVIITEDTDLETMDPKAFFPYTDVRDTALAKLDDAIAIAGSNSFVIPPSPEWINGLTITNTELVRIVNSYAARLIAYSPRSWEERAAVDWNEVLRRIDAGITQDLAPEGLLTVWESNMRRLYSRVRTARPTTYARTTSRWALPIRRAVTRSGSIRRRRIGCPSRSARRIAASTPRAHRQ
jgi:hypothetical protein